MPGLIGKKIGMTSVFSADRKNIPCTVIEVGPCVVTQVKTDETDGYNSIQVGFEEKKEKSSNKPEIGHFKKAGVAPMRHLAEFKDFGDRFKLGEQITVDIFNDVMFVDVAGVSKGKGFQGVVKRHGFGGMHSSHGEKHKKRHSGSNGSASDPAKVFKGTSMGGQMGNDRVTVKNLQVIKVIPEHNLLLLKGSVPGGKASILYIEK